MTGPIAVRRATPADAPELTRLRAVMLASLDGSTPDLTEEWALRCAAEFADQLARGSVLAAMVVDAPDGSGLAAGGLAVLDLRLPAPGRLGNRVGHISSMCTDLRWRRRGYASAVLVALTGWLSEMGCQRAELFASDQGLSTYRRAGFVDAPNLSLRLPLG